VTNENNLHVIVGLGKTGLSCVEFLVARGIPIAVTDSRDSTPYLARMRQQYPTVPIYLNGLNQSILKQASKIILSPGVALHDVVINACANKAIPICSDIELFANHVNAPVIAITGTNGKSTVTALVHQLAQYAGLSVAIGGNFGEPALSLLCADVQLYVLELSSFQLETTYSLQPKAATILNISPDHLDRYPDFSAYALAKQRVYQHCAHAIFNRADKLTRPQQSCSVISFGLDEPAAQQFGLRSDHLGLHLAYGDRCLLPVEKLHIKGEQNWLNALAGLALMKAIGISPTTVLPALSEFHGLAHRCQWLRDLNGVQWYNDSKGTNVGATCAAIQGLGGSLAGQIILIAGGQAKQADFAALCAPVAEYVRELVLIGEDAPLLEQALSHDTAITHASDMEQAVALANTLAKPGDAVLLSPACASFDMFNNFAHRGEVFSEMVRGLREY